METQAKPSIWMIWYMASRPRSLTATYVPVALGGVLAYDEGVFDALAFVLALLGTLMLQISANLLNEYYDYRKGADKQKTHGLGMIIARGLLSPRQVLLGGIITLLAGIVVGLYFVVTVGWLVLWIGVGGVLAVVFYTAGPYPLAYIGLGELAVFVFMGPAIVIGTYYVQAGEVSTAALWGGLPIGFLVANILHANNLRDLDADKAQNKYTLATIFGRQFARYEYIFLMAGAFVTPTVLRLVDVAPLTTIGVAVLLPEALRLILIVYRSVSPAELHQVLLGTARLHRWFGVIYIGAWLIDALIP